MANASGSRPKKATRPWRSITPASGGPHPPASDLAGLILPEVLEPTADLVRLGEPGLDVGLGALPERESGGGRAARHERERRADLGRGDVAARPAIGEELPTARGHHGAELARGVGLRVVDEHGLTPGLATVRRGVRRGGERGPGQRPARVDVDRLQLDRPARDCHLDRPVGLDGERLFHQQMGGIDRGFDAEGVDARRQGQGRDPFGVGRPDRAGAIHLLPPGEDRHPGRGAARVGEPRHDPDRVGEDDDAVEGPVVAQVGHMDGVPGEGEAGGRAGDLGPPLGRPGDRAGIGRPDRQGEVADREPAVGPRDGPADRGFAATSAVGVGPRRSPRRRPACPRDRGPAPRP